MYNVHNKKYILASSARIDRERGGSGRLSTPNIFFKFQCTLTNFFLVKRLRRYVLLNFFFRFPTPLNTKIIYKKKNK